ncbi:hypothetical protein AGMMS50212_11360 [Spirochaetia bacterium]|nr:hypothetical protein AGMMS50212_11360 [Spirochaetia bacterium]
MPVLLILVLFVSCSRPPAEDEIKIPVTPPLSREVIGYGVVNNNYIHVVDKQGEGGNTLGFLRKGSIVEISERRPLVSGEKSESWVFAKGAYSGWLRENELRIYPSKAQAETAAKNLQ